MQEETNEKTIALYIKTGKLTAQQLQKAMKALLAQMKKQHDRQKIPHGNRTATLSRPPVVSCGTRSDFGRIIVSGPGQYFSAKIFAFSGILKLIPDELITLSTLPN